MYEAIRPASLSSMNLSLVSGWVSSLGSSRYWSNSTNDDASRNASASAFERLLITSSVLKLILFGFFVSSESIFPHMACAASSEISLASFLQRSMNSSETSLVGSLSMLRAACIPHFIMFSISSSWIIWDVSAYSSFLSSSFLLIWFFSVEYVASPSVILFLSNSVWAVASAIARSAFILCLQKIKSNTVFIPPGVALAIGSRLALMLMPLPAVCDCWSSVFFMIFSILWGLFYICTGVGASTPTMLGWQVRKRLPTQPFSPSAPRSIPGSRSVTSGSTCPA